MAFSPLEGRVLGLQPCAGVGRVKRAPLICVACAEPLGGGTIALEELNSAND
jgi:hypothetical protein